MHLDFHSLFLLHPWKKVVRVSRPGSPRTGGYPLGGRWGGRPGVPADRSSSVGWETRGPRGQAGTLWVVGGVGDPRSPRTGGYPLGGRWGGRPGVPADRRVPSGWSVGWETRGPRGQAGTLWVVGGVGDPRSPRTGGYPLGGRWGGRPAVPRTSTSAHASATITSIFEGATGATRGTPPPTDAAVLEGRNDSSSKIIR
jgi:hypothetical protein